MASSRKRRPTADPLERALSAAVKSAVDQALSGTVAPAPAPRGRRASARSDPPLAVAYSGGRDSTALLSLVCGLRDARAPGFGRPRAVHVHHGLHRDADAWADHCARQCAAFDIELAVERVQVDRRGQGVEAAAREARYGALLQAARGLGAVAVLTAHHLDDRLETFLLQWIRGAGLEGLAGMAPQRELDSSFPRSGREAGGEGVDEWNSPPPRRGRGVGGEGASPEPVLLLRPLLHVPRERIERYVQHKGLSFVEDPSNADVRLERNAIRLRVMPELARLRSGFRGAAERSIELIAEGAEVLRSVARGDLSACTRDAPPSMLRIDRLAALPEARRTLVLREWLAQQQLPAPPRARLLEALRQAIGAGADARLLIRIGERELRRHRGLLCLSDPRAGVPAPHVLQWSGERELPVPGWGGTLRFTRTSDEGFDARWLGAEPLQLRPRTGGERFKPHPTRPSKRLKQIFQEAHIPEYERSALPLVWRDGRLIFVAGIGADARMLVADGERVRMDWIGAAPLLSD